MSNRFSQTLNEHIWRKAEKSQARRERTRLIRLGHIVPEYRMKPQLMHKDESGRWCPTLAVR